MRTLDGKDTSLSSAAGGSRVGSINNDDEITLDIRDDPAAAGGQEDPYPVGPTFGSSLLRNTSLHLNRSGSSLSDPAKSGAIVALKGLKFIANKRKGRDTSWPDVEAKFKTLTANTNGLLRSSQFGECLCMEERSFDFGEALFYALARRFRITQDSITKAQLELFWDQIADDNFNSRLQAFFDMVDTDADGIIIKDEIKEIIRVSAAANNLPYVEDQAGEYADLIMEVLDPHNVGYIMGEDLEKLLLEEVVRGDSQNNNLEVSEKEKSKTKERNSWKRWYDRAKYYTTYHWQRFWVIMLWLAACFALFIYKFVQYKNREDPFAVMGYCVCVAKGAAETLKLNMALILLPVCRNTITWLRNKTTLGVFVPFDDNINFHQLIAVGVIVGVVLHAGAHLTCDFPRILMASDQKYEEHLARYFGEERPASYWWFVKGWEGVTGIVMVFLMVVAFTLASPRLRKDILKNKLKKLKKWKMLPKVFNVFWYSHHLFVIVYALLLVHGIKLYLVKDTWQKTTWIYIAVPIMLYVIERLIRAFRSTIEHVDILKAVHYPGNLLALKMSRPEGFKYKSGQYMFVNCPTVSPFEWHPFSITSAPGDNYLKIHIRALGDWTNAIYKVFQRVNQTTNGNNPRYPTILIDGAYGAPAQDYRKYDIVLLIGLGIGATPMISIVKDINDNMRARQEEDIQALKRGKARSPAATTKKKDEFKTQRAYFYWVTTEGTFEWFKGIMNKLADVDGRKVIEMHNYCSTVYDGSDARSALIAMLQTLQYAKNGKDMVSGLRVKTHFARPDWRKVFEGIAHHHPDTTVGVFYCGTAGAVQEVKQLASEFSLDTKTKFVFHKENF